SWGSGVRRGGFMAPAVGAATGACRTGTPAGGPASASFGDPEPLEAERPDGVAPEGRVGLLGVHAGGGGQPVGDLEGLGPGAVGVRVVGLEEDRAHADRFPGVQTVLIVEDAAEDPALDVAARRIREIDVADAVTPDDVGPFEDVRHPADLTLGVD